jgi:HSP20 family protein
MLAPKSDLTEEPRDPLTDVFEEKDCVKVYLELPGIEKSDIQLNVTDTVMEIKARNFSETVKLPNVGVDSEKASASYKNGVLEVTVPKVQRTIDEEKKRTIRID